MAGEEKPVTEEVAPKEEVVKEAVEEKKNEQAAQQLGTDDLEERVANRVYDKIKGFVTELTTAATDVQQMVSETVASKQEEVAPVEEEMQVEDVKPKRSHKLFARPGKRE